MIVLTKDSTNSNIALTLNEKITLTSPNFLFEFISDTTETKYYVIPADTSVQKQRYNLFEIVEGVSDPTNGSLVLGEVGFYTYNVYEQASAVNLDPTGLTNVETGKLKYLGVNQEFTKHNITTEFVVHDPNAA